MAASVLACSVGNVPDGWPAPGKVEAGAIVAWAVAWAMPSSAPASSAVCLRQVPGACRERENHDHGDGDERGLPLVLTDGRQHARRVLYEIVLLELLPFLGFHVGSCVASFRGVRRAPRTPGPLPAPVVNYVTALEMTGRRREGHEI